MTVIQDKQHGEQQVQAVDLDEKLVASEENTDEVDIGEGVAAIERTSFTNTLVDAHLRANYSTSYQEEVNKQLEEVRVCGIKVGYVLEPKVIKSAVYDESDDTLMVTTSTLPSSTGATGQKEGSPSALVDLSADKDIQEQSRVSKKFTAATVQEIPDRTASLGNNALVYANRANSFDKNLLARLVARGEITFDPNATVSVRAMKESYTSHGLLQGGDLGVPSAVAGAWVYRHNLAGYPLAQLIEREENVISSTFLPTESQISNYIKTCEITTPLQLVELLNVLHVFKNHKGFFYNIEDTGRRFLGFQILISDFERVKEYGYQNHLNDLYGKDAYITRERRRDEYNDDYVEVMKLKHPSFDSNDTKGLNYLRRFKVEDLAVGFATTRSWPFDTVKQFASELEEVVTQPVFFYF